MVENDTKILTWSSSDAGVRLSMYSWSQTMFCSARRVAKWAGTCLRSLEAPPVYAGVKVGCRKPQHGQLNDCEITEVCGGGLAKVVNEPYRCILPFDLLHSWPSLWRHPQTHVRLYAHPPSETGTLFTCYIKRLKQVPLKKKTNKHSKLSPGGRPR